MRRAALILALLVAAAQVPAGAAAADPPEGLVLGLSQNRIAITANFDGTELLVFGAVKREAPIPQDGPLGVIVTVSGPSAPVTVWRKDRRFGIWINTDRVDVDEAPSFYAVATNLPWNAVISDTEDLRHKISIDRAIRSVGNLVSDSPAFTEALIRLRERAKLYLTRVETVDLSQETLFDVRVPLPANLVEGNYTAHVYLTRARAVIAEQETAIYVQKVGLERWLYALAHERPLVYGLLSLILAVGAGWAASEAFRYIRR